MFQLAVPRLARSFFVVALALCTSSIGCDDAPAGEQRSAPGSSAPNAAEPTVVSLVPAATDLILGMSAGDHLVAISNWDPPRPETASLPRVGDYRTVDWEQIASLRPDLMIVQFRPDKMPAGMESRAGSLGIKLVNVTNNRLDDVFTVMQTIGEALGEEVKATEAQRQLRAQLDAVRARVAAKTPVRTLIARTQSGLDVVGGGNFMDELLTLAGGTNVISTGENSYPTIDREMLLSLDPDVILQLLPGASPQEIEQARRFWETVPQLSAVKSGRVYMLTESYLLLPGHSVGRIAELLAQKLHPDTFVNDKDRS